MKPVRFLFFTDLHLHSSAPSRYRTDDYPTSILAKLDHVVEVANSEYDFIVFGGDFFESHAVYSFDVLNRLVGILKKLKVNFYYVWGNHDLKGSERHSESSSTFGFIARFFNRLIHIGPKDDVAGLIFSGINAWDEFPSSISCDVIVAHSLITVRPLPYDSHVIGTFGLDCRLCLSGDYHGKFIKRKGDTIFANPGSISRRRRDEKHTPSFLSVEIGRSIDVKRIEIPHARFDSIFSKAVEEEENEQDDTELDEFVKAVKNVDFSAVDIFELIEMLSRQKVVKVREKVLRYVLSKRG